LKDIVEKYVTFSGQCRGHCTKSTSLIELWSNRTKIVKASVCPDGYVSRVIAFSMHPDWSWFKDFLVNQGVEAIVRDRDLRPASRHGWELRTDISSTVRHISPTGNIYEVYWTTYPKTDEERRRGLFICSDDAPGVGCKRLFVQNINSQNRRCPKCGT
jgi:hypothetical protein